MEKNIFEKLVSFFSLKKESKFKIYDFIGILIIIIVWWAVSKYLGSTRLPSPWAVTSKIFSILIKTPEYAARVGEPSGILPHLWYTFSRTLIGGITGSILGVIMGFIMSLNKAINDIFIIPVDILRAIPPLGMIPFLLMIFGTTSMSQYTLIGIYCFLVMIIYTLNSIKNINPIYLSFAKTLGANKKGIFKTVTLPASLPELIGGVRVAIAMSWGFEVVAEMLGSQLGLGKYITIMVPFFAISNILAATIYILIVAVIVDRIFLYGFGYFIRWVPKETISR